MEVDRGGKDSVRTVWDGLVQEEMYQYEARRGFVQGSAISPLLWTVFFDMVIGELLQRGVRGSVKVDSGGGTGAAGGVICFADDTSVLAESSARLQTDADAVAAVFECQKNLGFPRQWPLKPGS